MSRQYLGRLGKVDLGQVGLFVSLVKGTFWCWVAGELYLPQSWFEADHAALREQVDIPAQRVFLTKTQLGLQLLERVRAQGVKFEAVGCDGFYGHDGPFRAELDKRNFQYMADIPANQRVYLSTPTIGVPTHTKGRQAEHERVLSPKAYRVDKLMEKTIQTRIIHRNSAHRELCDFLFISPSELRPTRIGKP